MKVNHGEVDAVIMCGLQQLAEKGYHRVVFNQDGVSTDFYIIGHVENGKPVWLKVVWHDGKPILPERMRGDT